MLNVLNLQPTGNQRSSSSRPKPRSRNQHLINNLRSAYCGALYRGHGKGSSGIKQNAKYLFSSAQILNTHITKYIYISAWKLKAPSLCHPTTRPSGAGTDIRTSIRMVGTRSCDSSVGISCCPCEPTTYNTYGNV